VPEYRLAGSSLHEPRTIWRALSAFKGRGFRLSRSYCDSASGAGAVDSGRRKLVYIPI